MECGPGFCVDRFEASTPVEVRAALSGFAYGLLAGDQIDVAPGVPDLRFLYLDADHSYEGTRRAWQTYAPKVVVGGHVALHDALELHPHELDWPDVNELMHVVAEVESWRLVAAAHRVVVFRRLA